VLSCKVGNEIVIGMDVANLIIQAVRLPRSEACRAQQTEVEVRK